MSIDFDAALHDAIARENIASSDPPEDEPPPAPVGMEAIEAAVRVALDAAQDLGYEDGTSSKMLPAFAYEERDTARTVALDLIRTALAARDERIEALEAALASQREGAMERIRELTARADALAVLVTDDGCDHRHRCTCGSGGHPRECKRHPNAYRYHVAELNAIGSVEAAEAEARLTEAIKESMEQRERIAKLEAGLVEACIRISCDIDSIRAAGDRDPALRRGYEDALSREVDALRTLADARRE